MTHTAETKQLMTEYMNNGYHVIECGNSSRILSDRIFGEKIVKLFQSDSRTVWATKPPKGYSV